MGFLSSIFGGGSSTSKVPQLLETQRQGRINLGLKQLGAIFEGGSVPFYTPQPGTTFDRNATYYLPNKSGNFELYWDKGVPKQLPSSWQKIALNPTKYYKPGMFYVRNDQTFEGFDPSFYKERGNAYENYALPQFGEQYRQTKDALNYGLADRGLLKSSYGDLKRSQVERTAGQAKQSIADNAIAQENELRQQVEQARQNATTMLYQTSNPTEASKAALSAASNYALPSTFAPLANMFTNILNQYYANQAIKNSQQPLVFNGSGTPSYSLSSNLGPVTY